MYNSGTSLKYFKRLKIYKNSNDSVSFDPQTLIGRSYRWEFLQRVDGLLIFNDYKWSCTTSGHQSAVRSVLRDLNLKPDLVGDFGAIEPCRISKETVRKMLRELFDLEIKIESSRESRAKNWRSAQANEIRQTIEKLETKMPKCRVSQTNKKTIYLEAVESAMDDISERHCNQVFKVLTMGSAKLNLEKIEV